MELHEGGFRCGEKRAARLMRMEGLVAVLPKRYIVTTDSNHNLPIAENILDRNFGAENADTKWTGDITYIWTGQGWLYLAIILDLFSRRVVGWAMDATIDRSQVINALEISRDFFVAPGLRPYATKKIACSGSHFAGATGKSQRKDKKSRYTSRQEPTTYKRRK